MSLTELFGGRKEETTSEIIVDSKGTTKDVNTGVETPPVAPPPTLDLPGVTPGLQEPHITINSQGEVKNVFTGEVHSSSQSVQNLPKETNVTPMESSQTDIDSKYQPLIDGKTDTPYQEVVKQVPTVTVKDPGGTPYYPKDAHLDIETGSYEAKEGSKPAPSNVDLIIEIKEKQNSTTQESGNDKPGDTPSKKQTYWEKDAERYEKFQDTGESQRTGSKRIDGRSKWTKEYNESLQKDATHQEALASNEEANKGVPSNNPLSEGAKSFFQREDQIVQDAKRDAVHQEALTSNEEANKGIPNNNPLSEGAKSFFQREDQIAEDAKRDAAHQEALASNEEANKGIPSNNPLSEGAKSFFQREDQIAEDARRAALNEGEEELTPEQLLQQRIDQLEAQLEQIRQTLEELRNSSRVRTQEGEDTPPLPQEDGEDTPPLPLEEGEDTPPVPPQQGDGERIFTETEVIDILQRQRAAMEAQRETERRDRSRQRNSLIVGAITGFGTAAVVASTALSGVAIGAGVVLVVARSAQWVGEKYQRNLSNRLGYVTDPEEREKIKKRLEFFNKINYGLRTYVVPFGGGFMAGLVAGSFFKTAVMGGESLMDKFASGGSGTTEIGTGGTGLESGNSGSSTTLENTAPNNLPKDIPQGAEAISTPEIPSQDVLVSNGKIDLPGSSWDNNLASNIGQAGELGHSSFSGGIYDQAASLAEKSLRSSGLTRSVLMDNLGTNGVHELLNHYLQAVQVGNTSPSLVNILGNMNNPGAENILSMIVK